MLLASSQLDALQTEDKSLPDEVQAAAQRFLDRIENPVPPAGKEARRKRLHKRKELGEIVSLQLRDIELPDGDLQLIGKLIRLESLDLRSSNITDKDLSLLAGLKNLRELSLEDTVVDGSGIAALSKLEKFQWIKTPQATANELVRRLERGEHANVAAMCSPGVNIPASGKLKFATLNEIEQSDSDRDRNWQRYHLEMGWTMDSGKHEIFFVNFSVERGTVFRHEAGISN